MIEVQTVQTCGRHSIFGYFANHYPWINPCVLEPGIWIYPKYFNNVSLVSDQGLNQSVKICYTRMHDHAYCII